MTMTTMAPAALSQEGIRKAAILLVQLGQDKAAKILHHLRESEVEAISSEMWETLNATYNDLPNQIAVASTLGPHNFFRYVKERAAVMAGLADATLSRDDGWRFFVLGRSLERVDMTCRLLSARFGEGAGSPGWVTLLRSCSAHEAYLRAFFPAAIPVPFGSAVELRAAVAGGKVDLAFGDGIAFAGWLNGPAGAACCAFAGGPFTASRFFGEGAGIAVKRGREPLRIALDYALWRLAQDGTYGDLWLKYFPVSPY